MKYRARYQIVNSWIGHDLDKPDVEYCTTLEADTYAQAWRAAFDSMADGCALVSVVPVPAPQPVAVCGETIPGQKLQTWQV
jgi:hypothetical protein